MAAQDDDWKPAGAVPVDDYMPKGAIPVRSETPEAPSSPGFFQKASDALGTAEGYAKKADYTRYFPEIPVLTPAVRQLNVPSAAVDALHGLRGIAQRLAGASSQAKGPKPAPEGMGRTVVDQFASGATGNNLDELTGLASKVQGTGYAPGKKLMQDQLDRESAANPYASAASDVTGQFARDYLLNKLGLKTFAPAGQAVMGGINALGASKANLHELNANTPLEVLQAAQDTGTGAAAAGLAAKAAHAQPMKTALGLGLAGEAENQLADVTPEERTRNRAGTVASLGVALGAKAGGGVEHYLTKGTAKARGEILGAVAATEQPPSAAAEELAAERRDKTDEANRKRVVGRVEKIDATGRAQNKLELGAILDTLAKAKAEKQAAWDAQGRAEARPVVDKRLQELARISEEKQALEASREARKAQAYQSLQQATHISSDIHDAQLNPKAQRMRADAQGNRVEWANRRFNEPSPEEIANQQYQTDLDKLMAREKALHNQPPEPEPRAKHPPGENDTNIILQRAGLYDAAQKYGPGDEAGRVFNPPPGVEGDKLRYASFDKTGPMRSEVSSRIQELLQREDRLKSSGLFGKDARPGDGTNPGSSRAAEIAQGRAEVAGMLGSIRHKASKDVSPARKEMAKKYGATLADVFNRPYEMEPSDLASREDRDAILNNPVKTSPQPELDALLARGRAKMLLGHEPPGAKPVDEIVQEERDKGPASVAWPKKEPTSLYASDLLRPSGLVARHAEDYAKSHVANPIRRLDALDAITKAFDKTPDLRAKFMPFLMANKGRDMALRAKYLMEHEPAFSGSE